MTEERKNELLQLGLSLDDIKFLTHQQGFNLATIRPRIKVSQCVCGNTTRRWYDNIRLWHNYKTGLQQFKCGKCGLEGGWAKTETKAKKLWNEAVVRAKEISNKDRLKEADK